jgi:hypothetical protein
MSVESKPNLPNNNEKSVVVTLDDRFNGSAPIKNCLRAFERKWQSAVRKYERPPTLPARSEA